MTNNDNINAMSVEEKANILYGLCCQDCVAYEICNGTASIEQCYAKIKLWLESEAEE